MHHIYLNEGHHKISIIYFCEFESGIYATYYLKCKKRIKYNREKYCL